MIHNTVVLSESVKLGTNVSIGPYSVLDGTIEIGDSCIIGPRCHITGYTKIGKNTKIHAGVVLGDLPQDRSFKGGISFTDVGENCVLREYVTIHRGAEANSSTLIENNVMLMAFVHIGHNCRIGENTNIANSSILGGHVQVGKSAFISAGSVVHQFVHIGQYALASAYARINKDIPPYCLLAEGDWIYGPNVVALKRAGFSQEVRRAIKECIKLLLFRNLNQSEALLKIDEDFGSFSEIKHFINFVLESERGFMSGVTKRQKTTKK